MCTWWHSQTRCRSGRCAVQCCAVLCSAVPCRAVLVRLPALSLLLSWQTSTWPTCLLMSLHPSLAAVLEKDERNKQMKPSSLINANPPPPQVPVRVVYLDRSLAPGGGGAADAAGGGGGQGVHVDTHDFVPEGLPPPAQPRVHLLYRPGHYVS